MHATCDRRDSGFLLVEAIIATTILAGALLALGHLFAGAARLNLVSRHLTMATTLASQKLEELRADGIRLSSGLEYLDASGAALPLDTGRAAYTRRWSITPDPSGSDGARLVVVVSPGSASHGDVTLTTLVVAP